MIDTSEQLKLFHGAFHVRVQRGPFKLSLPALRMRSLCLVFLHVCRRSAS